MKMKNEKENGIAKFKQDNLKTNTKKQKEDEKKEKKKKKLKL